MGVVEIFCQLKSVKENFYQGKEPSKPSKLGPSFPLKMHNNGIAQIMISRLMCKFSRLFLNEFASNFLTNSRLFYKSVLV